MNIEIDSANYMPEKTSSVSSDANHQGLLTELQSRLSESNFQPLRHNFSICDLARDDCLVISQDGLFWSVFYLERGRRHWPAFFYLLEDAITFFEMKVRSSANDIT